MVHVCTMLLASPRSLSGSTSSMCRIRLTGWKLAAIKSTGFAVSDRAKPATRVGSSIVFEVVGRAFMLPLLKSVADGSDHRLRDLVSDPGDQFGVTEEGANPTFAPRAGHRPL
jgi:hypothetical protein